MMRSLSKVIRSTILTRKELTDREEELLCYAIAVRLKAQAPYSHFLVGAAVQSESGDIYVGCNVERASWTQTTHAEQNAIDSMVAQIGPAKIKRLALIGGPDTQHITLSKKSGKKLKELSEVPVPCGHCLQIIWENCFNDPEVEIIALCKTGEIAKTTIGNAFPIRFGPLDLGTDYSKPTTK